MTKQVSLTTQNRLIISGLLLSTILIVAIAVFAIFNIQKNLNEGYQNFGQIVSKALAIECTELVEHSSNSRNKETLFLLNLEIQMENFSIEQAQNKIQV